jgi:hypothetical protein
MSETRITKRDNFTALRTIIGSLPAESFEESVLLTRLLTFIDHEVELLDKKRANKGIDTKRTAEQVAIMGRIENALAAADEPMRAGAIAKTLNSDGTPGEVSAQRVTALLRKMVEAQTVERVQGEKGVTLFTLT